LHRRDVLKLGIVGTASAILGSDVIAEAAQYYASAEPFVFPKPVYRTLGRTGLKLAVVGFGANMAPEPELMRLAFDKGVNYVDTARTYAGGRSEAALGRALAGRRDRVYVATKTLPSSTSEADIFRDVETSLKVLRTDYIDIIQLHSLTDKEEVYSSEARNAFSKLKQQGKVRFFGVTTHKNEAETLNAVVDDKERFFDMVLVKYNFKSSGEVADAISRAAKAGVGIVAMKTQAGAYSTKALGGISPHQAALKWVLENRNVTAAVPGMRDIAELKEDISVMGMPFTASDRRILERYNAAVKPFYCGLCGKCEATCPHGVEISTVNRSLMYAEGYRDKELALTTYRDIPVTASASVCGLCPECTAKCVNGLDIASKMEQARKILA